MQNISKLSATLCSAFLLSACDPAFETTAQKCASGQELEIIVSVDTTNGRPRYELSSADAESNGGYRLYLEQALEVMAPDTALTAPEDIAAKNFIDNEIDRFLSYQKTGDDVTGSENILDYMEYIIATTNSSEQIEAFVNARRQVAQGVADNDGFCTYTNDNIRIIDSNSDTLGYAETTLSYDPFTAIVQQLVLITEEQSDLNSSATRQTAPFAGFFQALPENFTSQGFIEPEVRQATLNDSDNFTSFVFDEANDTQLAQLVFASNTNACDPDASTKSVREPEALEDCAAGIPLHTPSALPLFDGVCDADVGKYPDHSYSLNGERPKRVRVEVDYFDDLDIGDDALGQIRIYTSNYVEAIESPDGDSIFDPTRCEKQAVLDELARRTPNTEVGLTFIPDPGYDIIYQDLDMNGEDDLDSEGNRIPIEPTPAHRYQGTVSAIRN